MSSRPNGADRDDKPTAAGCVVLVLTLAIILGSALMLVRWRDPETGRGLPWTVAIFGPFLLGAAFHGCAYLILKLVGVSIVKKAAKPTPEEVVEDLMREMEKLSQKKSTGIIKKRGGEPE